MVKNIIRAIVTFSIDHPKTVISIVLILTAFFALQFPEIKIDTDPENMLEDNQPDRIFYRKVKKDFGINDFIVVGVVDENGIYRTELLSRVDRAIAGILKIKGVIANDVVSLTTTDNIKAREGVLEIRPALHQIPQKKEELDKLRRDIAANPFLNEKIVSKDGRAAAIYIPIEKKDMSYRIGKEVEEILKRELGESQTFYMAGLPIAEDTFGYEMFMQMAVSAPMAGLGIMLLLYIMLRKLGFVFIPMMDAMFSIIWAMGALIGMGFTVHIMSSMIPIFLMPIAILNDTHVLSEFADRYPAVKDKRKTLLEVMEELYIPSFYAPLTTAVGFASLSLTHIPPVRVFGLFTAFGILAAWLFSVTVVPASIMLMNEKGFLKTFAHEGKHPWQKRILKAIGNFSWNRNILVIIGFSVLFIIGIYGISLIQVNDNPVRWFKERHPLRQADKVMNQFFGGTYMAYLVAEGDAPEAIKSPVAMRYLDNLQGFLEKDPIVGKTSSVVDIVKRINFVLHDEDKDYDAVPDNKDAIGQMLFLFQSSGDPDDLDNFLDIDARQANIWIQMKGGDNQQMAEVEKKVNAFIKDNPLPPGIKLSWSGLTYINKVWQMIMVKGMLFAVIDSFIVVFLLIALQLRSPLAGLLAMFPITISIVTSYGLLGLAGKDYDMPIAVCAVLALGLGDDFAIHFFHRIKQLYLATGSLEESNTRFFQEPAMAGFRMTLVIAVGFSPLLLSSLTPYVTVGLFFASLMIFASMVTLILLPAVTRLSGHIYLKKGD
ncbi:MAG: MMPL family transporter [Deltaproteobacteria bacterium]